MNNKIIFLRHAPTLKNPNLLIEQWGIKPESFAVLGNLAKLPEFSSVDTIFASTKTKAIDTAKFFSQPNNLMITTVEELVDIKKPGAQDLSPEDYEKLKLKILENPDVSIDNCEPANHALERFTQAINKIDSENNGKNILIVSHGSTMTLYFAKLQNQLANLLPRWQGLKFGNWGLIENGIVVKDIV